MKQLFLSILISVSVLGACSVEPELLNSERIERQFGSYGIDVITQISGLRRSNLYSEEDGLQTCRTYAIVEFVDPTEDEIKSAHQAILAGASIGEMFRSAGWQIGKQTIHIGTIQITNPAHPIGRLMRLVAPAILATHAYKFVLIGDSQLIHYATIIETHHPAYLTERNLHDLFTINQNQGLEPEQVEAINHLLLDAG